MRTKNCFLSKSPGTFFTSFFVLLFLYAAPQVKTDGTNWKTWVVSNISENVTFAAPTDMQAEAELQTVKEMTGLRDERIMRQIQYWDAGAPSYRWNTIAYQIVGPELFTKKDGGKFWYSPMAWMNMAIYDATVAAMRAQASHQRKSPFELDPSIKPVAFVPEGFSYPCLHSTTAAAASTVLAHFFPELSDSLTNLAREASQSRIYAGVQFPSSVTDGWKLGEEIAKKVIEQSGKHGYNTPWKGKIPNDSKLWRGDYAVGAITTGFKPLVMKSGSQFRPAAPPDFAKEMEEIKNLKQNFRTVHQAYYWANLSGLDIWTDLASQKLFEYRLDTDPLAAARIYTLLHVALHDAAIAIMDAKYAYWGIRPDQYDKTFKPLLGFTPPFPGYPSGHATASSAAATVLSHFFPADAAYFKKLATECAESRFYGGIHFPSDNTVGIEMGEKLASYIIENRE